MLTQLKKRWEISEDWTVVILAFIIIILAIVGIHLPAPAYGWDGVDSLVNSILFGKNIKIIGGQFVIAFSIALIGAFLTGKSVKSIAKIFPLIYVVTLLASLISGNIYMGKLGLETVIFSLLLGLIISNFFRLPEWFHNTLATELYVKIGLVLLGSTIIFSDILKAGALGLLQALVVVVSVWYFAFWVCKKLKVDKDLSLMISSSVSICGVSAAIATAGAIKGDSKKLSYVISLVLLCAVPMLVGMPYLAKWLGLSQPVTGAWLGGTIDTTGAVVGAGALVGDEALKYATIVKFSQNVLLGLAAFAISIYWTYTGKTKTGEKEKVSGKIIWQRFPKFVIGFVAASLLFSFLISDTTIQQAKDTIKSFQGLWFTLAFTCIGLETRFSDFFKQENKRPLAAFLIAQGFNVLITLVVSYILFHV